jgi:prepilin-type N-terminal cleavage/methylation domain-containing protein/prepilin-type processing-associated H-X9-DG protein
MRVSASRKGFSLVELLTVIAIIAILASIIFPVMALVGNKARMNKCITQLHEIGVAVQMFKQDNRQYPDILGIPADGVHGCDVVRPNTTTVTGLFPEYVKSFRLYHCPMSKIIDTMTTVTYDPGGGPIQAYAYNSYDFMNIGTATSPVIQQHYTKSWVDTPANVGVNPYLPKPNDNDELKHRDYERQLKFRTPPDDTVVTWCSWHEVPSGGSVSGKAPVLFLDGHVDTINAGEVETQKWRVEPKKE